MTHKLFPAIEGGLGAQVVLMGRQATAHTDPVLGVGDVKHMIAWSCDPKVDHVTRSGTSPDGPGFKGVKAGSYVPFSGEMEIKCPTITNANSTDYPECDPVLYGAQCKLTSDATDKTHTYVLARSGSQITAFYDQIYNEDDDDGVQVIGLDAQMAIGLRWEASEDPRLMLSFDGKAGGYQSSNDWSDVLSDIGAGSGAVVYSSDDPALALGVVAKIIDLRDNSLFGGGSLASPSSLLMLTSFEFTSGQTVNVHRGAQATGGVKRTRSIRDGYGVVTLEGEMTVLADFNPRDWESDNADVEVNLIFSAPSSPNNTVQFLTYGTPYEVEFDKAGKDGRRLFRMKVECNYAEAADGDPGVGTSPNQEFEAGTNQGLGLQPTATLAKGIAALQFRTTA